MSHEQKTKDKSDTIAIVSSGALLLDNPDLDPGELSALSERISYARSQLIEDLGVDQELDGSRRSLLDLIATEMVATEELEDEVIRRRRRDALTDATLVLFGDASTVNRQRFSDSLDPNFKYIDAEASNAQTEFMDGCVNKELTERFTIHFLSSQLFEEQCTKLGTRPSFEVQVLDILQSPDEADEFVDIDTSSNDGIYERSLQNSIDYDNSLREQYGGVPTAWVRIDAVGASVLVMRSSTALRILGNQVEGDKRTEKALSNLRHEISHTAKRFLFGASIQFGKLVEERKAEALSGDKAQYIDILRTFRAVSDMSGVDITKALVESVQSDEHVTDYLEFITQSLGPKFALMLMLSSPSGAYDSADHLATSLDVEAFFEEGDTSGCDVLFRIVEEKFGSQKYVEKAVRPQAEDIANGEIRIEEGVIGMLRANGLSRMADIYRKEFDRIATNQAARNVVGSSE